LPTDACIVEGILISGKLDALFSPQNIVDALPGRWAGVVGVKHQIHNLNSCAKSRTCRVHASSRPQSTLKLLVVSNVGVETPPFFQTLNVIAAIFLAKVRRAIVGLAPLASKCETES
jgi:hypothetical protein